MTTIADKLREHSNALKFFIKRQTSIGVSGDPEDLARVNSAIEFFANLDPDAVFEIPDPDTVEVSPEIAEHSRKIRPFVLHPDEAHLVINWARGFVTPGKASFTPKEDVIAALAKLEKA